MLVCLFYYLRSKTTNCNCYMGTSAPFYGTFHKIRKSGSNEYPQSMFRIKSRKKNAVYHSSAVQRGVQEDRLFMGMLT